MSTPTQTAKEFTLPAAEAWRHIERGKKLLAEASASIAIDPEDADQCAGLEDIAEAHRDLRNAQDRLIRAICRFQGHFAKED